MVAGRAPGRATSPPLFGRGEVLEEVNHLIDRTRAGHGQGLLITGAGGAGKSRVLRSAVDRARDRQFRVLTGRALPEDLPAPFSLVRDLLGSMGDEEDWAPVEGVKAVGLPLFLAPFGEEPTSSTPVAQVARRAAPAPDDLERILAPLGRSTVEGLAAGRQEMLQQLGEYFRSLAHDHPILLAIDDLQFADTSSLEFLNRFTLDLPQISAAVIATVGVGAEVPGRTRASIEALRNSPAFRSLALPPFTVPEVTEFVRWILGGRSPDPQDVLRWHAQTEGNPLFVEQLVRTVTGYDSRIALGPSSTSRDVNEILLERVKALGEGERRVLTYGAVLGKEFEFFALAAVAGMGEERVTESLDRLVQGGLLREKGGEVYEFVTEAVRADVYADLTETRRRILHRKAGLALEAKGDVSDSELARQFYLGRDDARAVKYNVAAAQAAIRAFAFETAIAHLARALEAERRRPDRDPRAEVRLLTEEGRLLTEVGSLPRSEEVLREAVDLARSKPGFDLELGRALLGLAHSRAERSEYSSAETLAKEASSILERVGTPRDLMAAHRVLGVVYWRRGELEPAEAHQRAALEIAEHEGTPLEQGHALVDVAITMVPMGPTRVDPALDLLARAADLFRDVKDHGARARVLMNRAVTLYTSGRTDAALEDIAVAIEAAERSRSPIWIGYCNLNLAQWQAELHRPALARPPLERAVEVLVPTRDRLGEQQILMTRGMIAHAEGAFDAAEALYRDGLALARELNLPSEASEMLLRLAQLSHDRGDDTAARDRLEEARKSGLLAHRPDLAPRAETLAQSLPPAA
jgi:tetratricopeptide (TPR) repeat protein